MDITALLSTGPMPAPQGEMAGTSGKDFANVMNNLQTRMVATGTVQNIPVPAVPPEGSSPDAMLAHSLLALTDELPAQPQGTSVSSLQSGRSLEELLRGRVAKSARENGEKTALEGAAAGITADMAAEMGVAVPAAVAAPAAQERLAAVPAGQGQQAAAAEALAATTLPTAPANQAAGTTAAVVTGTDTQAGPEAAFPAASTSPPATATPERAAGIQNAAADATRIQAATPGASNPVPVDSTATHTLDNQAALMAEAGERGAQGRGSGDALAFAVDHSAGGRPAATQGPQAAAATSTSMTAQASLSAPVASPAWQQQLGQQLSTFTQRGQHKIELHLHPADLGPLSVSLKVDDQGAQAQFLSSHATVRTAVEQAIPQLREALAEQGIALGETSVGEQQRQSGESGESGENGEQPNQRDGNSGATQDGAGSIADAAGEPAPLAAPLGRPGVDLYA